MSAAAPAESPRRFVVGLTGGIGSGKSTVADLFATHGAAVVDTDLISRQLTAPGGAAMAAIAEAFGARFLTPEGALDRAAMRARIFAEPAARARLEAIMHPRIRATASAALTTAAGPYSLLVVPLLLETGHYQPLCQRILVVDCSEETQVRRVMRRSGLSREETLAILASQASRAQRLAAANDVIDNEGAPASLPARVAALHERYILAAQKQNPDA